MKDLNPSTVTFQKVFIDLINKEIGRRASFQHHAKAYRNLVEDADSEQLIVKLNRVLGSLSDDACSNFLRSLDDSELIAYSQTNLYQLEEDQLKELLIKAVLFLYS